jgi:hypothetical protein
VLQELQEQHLRRAEDEDWDLPPIIRTAREEEELRPTDIAEPHPLRPRDLIDLETIWNADADPRERSINGELVKLVETLAVGRIGNGAAIGRSIRHLQHRAMQRRAGVRRKRQEPNKVDMETLTVDQLLIRTPIEDWPTPCGGHSPELVYSTVEEYEREASQQAETTILKGGMYISRNQESPAHLHTARMLGMHLFSEHQGWAWLCPYCQTHRFKTYRDWEFHVRQMHHKERIIREDTGDFWTWLIRERGRYGRWPRVVDIFQKKGARYTFRAMTEQELEEMWWRQSETADDEPPEVLKDYVEEIDRGLEAADAGQAFEFNASVRHPDDIREFQAEEPLYRIPEE